MAIVGIVSHSSIAESIMYAIQRRDSEMFDVLCLRTAAHHLRKLSNSELGMPSGD